jgi:hypothetical protein
MYIYARYGIIISLHLGRLIHLENGGSDRAYQVRRCVVLPTSLPPSYVLTEIFRFTDFEHAFIVAL